MVPLCYREGPPTESPVSNEPKIMSIAPSFNCQLKCEGCYLTTDVTKEMRLATKTDYYWKRAMKIVNFRKTEWEQQVEIGKDQL